MKKILFTSLAAAAMMTSCNQSTEYVIYGAVTDPGLEGAKIFLVPVDNPVVENIDSTYIIDQTFEFRGTEEVVADIRIERMRRFGTETLLVVTEPGEIYATIGKVSTGRGTPQNDSIQLWKNLTKKYYQQSGALKRQGLKDEANVLHEKYVARTREMASNVGKKSTLGVFLDSRFPEEAN